MTRLEALNAVHLAVRCHDVPATLSEKQVGEFDELLLIGIAVRPADFREISERKDLS